MKIVSIGDSLTTGFGVFKEKRWTDIASTTYNIPIINKGINGDTTSSMVCRFYDDVITLKPSHVIIMGGCNDFLSYRNLINVTNNIIEMLKDSESAHIIPILCTEIPVIPDIAKRKWSRTCDYEYVIENTIKYREWILSYTNKNKIICLDFYKLFIDKFNLYSPKELYIDGLHPSELGHRLMAEEILKIFSSSS